MRCYPLNALLLPLLLMGVLCPAARAADGVIEINDAKVKASGGYPFTISTPGSYRLTSNLPVPAGVTAGIVVSAPRTRIDLNGFTISSTTVCSGTPPTCAPTGTGTGVDASGASDVGVRNGSIAGFGVYGLQLFDSGRVKEVTVESNGLGGILCEVGCVVEDSIVRRNGGGGIQAGAASRIARNVVNQNNGPGISTLGSSLVTDNAVSNNVGTSVPDSHSRHFYLTQNSVDGAGAPSACAAGFHMASLWEILDPSHLQYDTTLGRTAADSGLGPPSHEFGWVRTGFLSSSSNVAGTGNCDAGTVFTPNTFGTLVSLQFDWTQQNTEWPWQPGTLQCDANHNEPVWCVQD